MGSCFGAGGAEAALFAPLALQEQDADAIVWQCAPPAQNARVFNVLAVFTPDAVTEDMSRRELAESIAQAMDEMNEAFTNSGIDVQGALTTIAPTHAYLFEGQTVSPPVDRYKAELLKEGGQFDDVHQLRARHNAHVVLFVTGTDGGGDPEGGALPATNKREAFVIVPANKLLGQYTPAHEIGHLFGAKHDAGGFGLHPKAKDGEFAHGHVTEHWRTIMSYHQMNGSKIWGKEVIPYFSNPNVDYQGEPTGTPQANNAAQIRDYADTLLKLPD